MRVLAALDDSECALPVSEFAAVLAPVLGAEVDAVHVPTDGGDAARTAAAQAGLRLRLGEGSPRSWLLREAADDDIAAIVLGRSHTHEAGPIGAIAAELVTTQPKPVAVVPAGALHPCRLGRVLVPLEGSRPTSLAPRRVIGLARDAGLEIVLLHVFDVTSLPACTDQPQHETRAWAAEFLARYSPVPLEHVRFEMRVGEPKEHVVAVARETDADVIALGWAQELAAGRAPVVRAALEDAKVPVVLIPVTVDQTVDNLTSAAA
jgi:nucleotide-binding universal stress UspA family protein